MKTVGKTTGFDVDFDLLEIMMTAAGYDPETDLAEYIYREFGLLDGEDFHFLNSNSIIYNPKDLGPEKIKMMNQLKNKAGIR